MERVQHLNQFIRGEDEIWWGLTSPAKRRLLQNRINARAHRKRQSVKSRSFETSEVLPQKDAVAERLSSNHARSCEQRVSLVFKAALMHNLRTLRSPYANPTSDLLLSLVSYNVFRAFMNNMQILGIDASGLTPYGAVSPFLTNEVADFTNLPFTMRPTSLQTVVKHHPCFDAFPDSRFRDNILSNPSVMENEDLCMSLAGFNSSRECEPDGLVVWGEPYLISSWEMTETFFHRWYDLLSDCQELIQSSNRWRGTRGERLLRPRLCKGALDVRC